MSIVKEFREFFLRHIQVTSGTKIDQESNFPTNYNVGTVSVFNRFLKGDFPNESVFKKLFESITFKKNIEDTFTFTEQGLARKATDTESVNRTIATTNSFQPAVIPEQLPDVRATNTTIAPFTIISTESLGGITIQSVNKDLGSSRFKRDFNIKLTVPPPPAPPIVASLVEFSTSSSRYIATTNIAVPDLGIIIWQNDIPPTGYLMCDGTNGTPDLRAFQFGGTKFIRKIATP